IWPPTSRNDFSALSLINFSSERKGFSFALSNRSAFSIYWIACYNYHSVNRFRIGLIVLRRFSPQSSQPKMNSTAKSPEKVVSAPVSEKHDAYAALRIRDFRLFLSGHLLSVLGVQMQNAAIGWQLYEKNNSKLAAGIGGRVQIVPLLGVALPAGQG